MSGINICEKIKADYKATMEYVEWLKWNIEQWKKALTQATNDFSREWTLSAIRLYERALRENLEFLEALSRSKCITMQ